MITTVFGVGCIEFRYATDSEPAPGEFSIVQFKKDIIDELERIENISNIIYQRLDDEYTGFRSFELDQDNELWPIPPGFHISFNVLIPSKIHENYLWKLDIERFRVDILYGYDKPVAYRSYDWAGEASGASPSSVVSVIRKFLSERMTGKIVCGSVGPSPFHADFYVGERSSQSTYLVDRSKDVAGYALFEVVPATENGLSDSICYLNETISRYYYLSTQRSIMNRNRMEILTGFRKLLQQRDQRILKRTVSTLRSGRAIDSVHDAIIKDRVARVEIAQYISEAERSGEIGSGTALARFFAEYRENVTRDSWPDFSDAAGFFENRRQKLFENLNVLAAGIAGGLIGALIGAGATLHASHSYQSAESSALTSSIHLPMHIRT